MANLPELVAQAADLIGRAQYAVALTGAGISTPSGIPDFRSPQSGMWERADPFEVASLLAFRYEPERFYAWVRPLAALMRQAQPNPAHCALAELEQRGRLRAVITQNIDELHTRAGSRHVLEVHGSLQSATCLHCGVQHRGQGLFDRFVADGQAPRCPDCGAVVKPDVILMGEELRQDVLHAARREARRCDVMLVAGSSLEVMPAAGLPQEALAYGARLILVNLQPTYLDERATVLIRGDVAGVLPQIARAVAEMSDAGD
jgi:NAD-dependent deacetylase